MDFHKWPGLHVTARNKFYKSTANLRCKLSRERPVCKPSLLVHGFRIQSQCRGFTPKLLTSVDRKKVDFDIQTKVDHRRSSPCTYLISCGVMNIHCDLCLTAKSTTVWRLSRRFTVSCRQTRRSHSVSSPATTSPLRGPKPLTYLTLGHRDSLPEMTLTSMQSLHGCPMQKSLLTQISSSLKHFISRFWRAYSTHHEDVKLVHCPEGRLRQIVQRQSKGDRGERPLSSCKRAGNGSKLATSSNNLHAHCIGRFRLPAKMFLTL